MRTFFDWIKTQVLRDDLVGDLAKDIVADAESNELEYRTADEWKRHVKLMASHVDALRELRENTMLQLGLDPAYFEDDMIDAAIQYVIGGLLERVAELEAGYDRETEPSEDERPF